MICIRIHYLFARMEQQELQMSVNGFIFWCSNRAGWRHTALGGLLLALLLVPAAVSAAQDKEGRDGFLSARFGMSPEEVLAALKADGVRIDSDQTKNGARQIRGKREGELTTNSLIYVIPETSNKLAMVIEFYDSPKYHKRVLEGLREQLGDDLGAEIAEMTMAQAAGAFPPGLKELTLWAITAGDSNLLVRLMRFDNYLAVERLDAKLMSKQ